MASRAILRRKRVISDYLNASTRTIQSLQCLGHAAPKLDTHIYNGTTSQSSSDVNYAKELERNLAARAGLFGFSRAGQFRHGFYSTTILGHGRLQTELVYPRRSMLLSVRDASTVTAKQPDLGSDDENNEEIVARRRKEASPEECDQAVEGLSTAKAKVKAKRLHESQKVAESILQRTWAMLLGIGPALRMIASMSRLKPLRQFCSFSLFFLINNWLQSVCDFMYLFAIFSPGRTGPRNFLTGNMNLSQH